jgi:hypothetical protein
MGTLGAVALVFSSLGGNGQANAGILTAVAVDPVAQTFIARPSPTPTTAPVCTIRDDRTCLLWWCWGSCVKECCYYSGDQYLCGASPCS